MRACGAEDANSPCPALRRSLIKHGREEEALQVYHELCSEVDVMLEEGFPRVRVEVWDKDRILWDDLVGVGEMSIAPALARPQDMAYELIPLAKARVPGARGSVRVGAMLRLGSEHEGGVLDVHVDSSTCASRSPIMCSMGLIRTRSARSGCAAADWLPGSLRQGHAAAVGDRDLPSASPLRPACGVRRLTCTSVARPCPSCVAGQT